jgi:hypothetical protein
VRSVLLLFALALAACQSDVDPPWQLSHDRIIAVRAEPPGILPGEQSRIDMLAGYAAEPVRVRAPDVAAVVSPESLADVMAIDAEGWVVTAPSAERLAQVRSELGMLPDAAVPLRIGVAAAWPTPVQSLDGRNLAATKVVWLGEQAHNPEVTGVRIDGREAPPEGTEIVVPRDAEVRLSVEADDSKDIVNWLTSCGEMHDFDLASAYLTFGPEDPTEGELVLVVRDDRGGVTWRVWPIRAE